MSIPSFAPGARARSLVSGGLLAALLAVAGCGRSAAVQTSSSLPLRRVVVYRNGVGYFERQGHVSEGEVRFRVTQREVDDFLATLAVMEQGGSSVRSAAFPLPEEHPASEAPAPDAARTVRLTLDGREHDLLVGYTVETPIWRPSYRLVFNGDTTQVQAWGIVQNISGEDWSDVNLSLVAGAPVSFRSELSRPVVPRRPTVTDQGAVIDAVPLSDTTLAEAPEPEPAPGATEGDAMGYGGLGLSGSGTGGGGTGEGTIGLGDVGTMGHGAGTGTGQGYGSGAGRGLRERSSRQPTVRASPPMVSGRLSPEAIRRVVLRNLGQVQHCHEQALAQNPSAAGRVTVRFVIGGNGRVQASAVAASSYPVASAPQCIANAVRRWQFPTPEGGGLVTVTYPFTLTAGDSEASNAPTAQAAARPTAGPRNVSALAALAVQGGVTRYDLPNRVTVPDRSATMVMLVARDVPGAQMYLFAPDPGVPDSSSHPFHVARFENRTGALLERGPIAIFEAGAYLGQGLLEPLPDAATTTVPFALERGLAVEHSATAAVEGARLLTMLRGELTIERFNVVRTTYRVRNGVERTVRVLMRHALNGAQLHEPPAGTEQSGGNALAPIEVPAHGRGEVIVTTRSAFTDHVELSDEQAAAAIEVYLRDGRPSPDVALALRTALDLRRQLDTLTRERADVEQRRDDLQTSVAETRENLLAIQRNAQAADLRAQLTARLGRGATQLDQLTRRIVELDTQMGERRVRLAETVRGIDVDVSRAAAPAASP
ncbi:MAG: AgmX/PglI C-terminal domain-containing protein [Deltaproteobacteria bacterium]|nr:AgmX/PglI C-terminal domain-containing protein [Myxococcales bacterium]MDP3214769.1 AgmX/PglI C-terminal domain-containing protein [Deltaproteobacteria bacterium]